MLSLSRLPWMNLRGYPVRTGTLILFSMLMTMTIFGGTLVVQGIEHGLRTA
ncbi:MAG: ABC transporter permease, partial [Schaalia sp.]|nr:ABC transporter permease [Schaalia sp.]